jgi:K+/H+ antiporter YhaU regulatory subunit KhtT
MTVREILREIGELSNDERREVFSCLADAATRAASVKYIDREEAARSADKILNEHAELFRKLAEYESANSAS